MKEMEERFRKKMLGKIKRLRDKFPLLYSHRLGIKGKQSCLHHPALALGIFSNLAESGSGDKNRKCFVKGAVKDLVASLGIPRH